MTGSDLIQLLEKAGSRGMAVGRLREKLGSRTRELLDIAIARGEAVQPGRQSPVYAAALAPGIEPAKESLLGVLRKKPDQLHSSVALSKALPARLRPWLKEALEQLLAGGEVLKLRHGNSRLYLANPASSPEQENGLGKKAALHGAYEALVAEQGGFVDVALHDLRTKLQWSVEELHRVIRRLLRDGAVTLRRASTASVPKNWKEAAIHLPGEAEPMVKLEWLPGPSRIED